jgi:hypothetical protein
VARRLFAALLVAVLAGLASSLRDLVLPQRAGPLPVESLVLVGFLLAIAVSGWFAGRSVGMPLGVGVAALSALVVVAVAIAAKQARYPAAPLTGDGFEILLAVYVGVGSAAGLLGARAPVGSTRVALGVACLLIAAAAIIAAVPYLLPAIV